MRRDATSSVESSLTHDETEGRPASGLLRDEAEGGNVTTSEVSTEQKAEVMGRGAVVIAASPTCITNAGEEGEVRCDGDAKDGEGGDAKIEGVELSSENFATAGVANEIAKLSLVEGKEKAQGKENVVVEVNGADVKQIGGLIVEEKKKKKKVTRVISTSRMRGSERRLGVGTTTRQKTVNGRVSAVGNVRGGGKICKTAAMPTRMIRRTKVVIEEKQKKEVKKIRLSPEQIHVIECLRMAQGASKGDWRGKLKSLGAFCEAMKGLGSERMKIRVAEEAICMLGDYVLERHHRVILAALDGLFFLLLCTEGIAQRGALTRALEKRGDVLKRVLMLLSDGKDDVRLSSERVMESFGVQFDSETQVGLIVRAINMEGRGGVCDQRVVESGCAHVVRAFERARTSGLEFVWREQALKLVLKGMQTLVADRRLGVRKAAGNALSCVKLSLPNRAYEMACVKFGISLP